MDWKSLRPGDPALINKIVEEYMSQGKFDHLRRQLMSQVDTKSSYQNVKQRMESTVRSFLIKQRWRPDLNKNHLRDSLKKQILAAHFLRPGIKRIVEQLANRSAMIDLRPDLEVITKGLLDIKDEPEAMDTTQDEIEPMDSPEDTEMVIVTEDEPPSEEIKTETSEDTVPGEEKPFEKLVGAMEDLEIPKEENNSPSQVTQDETEPVIKSEPAAEESMIINYDTGDVPAESEFLSDEDSDHSIINQMSPISAGTPSPPPSPTPIDTALTPIKRASQFVGKIPKVKKDTLDEEKPQSGINQSKNGLGDDRKDKPMDKSKESDRKSGSDRSRDKTSRSDDKPRERSRDRDRNRDSRRRDDRSKTSERDSNRKKENSRDKSSSNRDSDRDKSKSSSSSRHRSHRRDGDRESRDNHSSKDRDRHKDKYKSSDRSKDRSSDKRKEETSKTEIKSNDDKINEIEPNNFYDSEKNKDKNGEIIEKHESEDVEKGNKSKEEVMDCKNDRSPQETAQSTNTMETDKEDDAIKDSDGQGDRSEEQSGSESIKTADESSQDASASEDASADKPGERPPGPRVFKPSIMMTRSKGKAKTTDSNKAAQSKGAKGKKTVRR